MQFKINIRKEFLRLFYNFSTTQNNLRSTFWGFATSSVYCCTHSTQALYSQTKSWRIFLFHFIPTVTSMFHVKPASPTFNERGNFHSQEAQWCIQNDNYKHFDRILNKQTARSWTFSSGFTLDRLITPLFKISVAGKFIALGKKMLNQNNESPPAGTFWYKMVL